ncbi:chaplin [Streptomyces sp. NRRL B-3648]|uniref:chaplin n=1 Tax=Streptomyces sp. NRRL B-3648 TaxID=1519493 RepID=UPI0006AE23AA|nr:chaplin [Streptomyces sp. NRRL B-3648]KOX11510.1 hypothetical protein ADL04_01055 [Streptomyces sp. NRRL B-3648]
MAYLRSRVMRSAGLVAAAGAAVLGGAAAVSADSGAQGVAIGSPGVLSGNVIQVPVDVPVNACGDTVDVIGLLNPAFPRRSRDGDARRFQPGDPLRNAWGIGSGSFFT